MEAFRDRVETKLKQIKIAENVDQSTMFSVYVLKQMWIHACKVNLFLQYLQMQSAPPGFRYVTF